jgi:uncharacterized membrane protein
MAWLILGLVLFLGAHSVRIFADDWRSRTIEAWGEKTFKGIYAVVSLVGFYALIVGYSEARMQPFVIWQPPTATRHISVLLMLFASILLVATYIPRNHFKLRMGHPMILSVKVWALSHLLANGNLADLVLFGTFLAWSVLIFRVSRARDRANAAAQSMEELAQAPQAKLTATLAAFVLGALLWASITFHLHALVVGISPMGR